MNSDLQDNPKFQSDFFRDSFRKVLGLIVIEVFVILGLLLAITYFVFFQPGSHYYVTTTGGIVLPLNGGKVALTTS
jgi:hypothetical protein